MCDTTSSGRQYQTFLCTASKKPRLGICIGLPQLASWRDELFTTGLLVDALNKFKTIVMKVVCAIYDHSVRFVTNNSRVVGNYTGGWSTPAVIATGTTITGIGSVGITGMKGRGNTTNGQ